MDGEILVGERGSHSPVTEIDRGGTIRKRGEGMGRVRDRERERDRGREREMEKEEESEIGRAHV